VSERESERERETSVRVCIIVLLQLHGYVPMYVQIKTLDSKTQNIPTSETNLFTVFESN
jgi:hypothetical protein